MSLEINVNLRRLTDKVDDTDKHLTAKIDDVDKRLTAKIDDADKRLTQGQTSLTLMVEKGFAEAKIARAADRVWWLLMSAALLSVMARVLKWI
jgi:hypothetical protein